MMSVVAASIHDISSKFEKGKNFVGRRGIGKYRVKGAWFSQVFSCEPG